MKVAVELTDSEAKALAQMVKRFGHHHAVQLSSRYDFYDGAAEHDVMMDAVLQIQRALREKGYAPR